MISGEVQVRCRGGTGEVQALGSSIRSPHLALVELDLFVGVCLPGQLLQLFGCVLTRL